MPIRRGSLFNLILGRSQDARPSARRPRPASLSCEGLETRVVPAHGHFAHHALAHLHAATASTTGTSTTTSSSSSTSGTTTSSTSGTTGTTNSALTTALQTLHGEEQTIELASGTTIGQLTAITSAFQTLSADGLTPSSQSALSSFEDSLVTANASGTTLAGNATLLAQFEASTRAPRRPSKPPT